MTTSRPIDNPGAWLATECRDLGVSIHRVAVEAKLSPSTLHRWTAGTSTPYWHAFERVRSVLERMRREKRGEREASFWDDRERRGA